MENYTDSLPGTPVPDLGHRGQFHGVVARDARSRPCAPWRTSRCRCPGTLVPDLVHRGELRGVVAQGRLSPTLSTVKHFAESLPRTFALRFEHRGVIARSRVRRNWHRRGARWQLELKDPAVRTVTGSVSVRCIRSSYSWRRLHRDNFCSSPVC